MDNTLTILLVILLAIIVISVFVNVAEPPNGVSKPNSGLANGGVVQPKNLPTSNRGNTVGNISISVGTAQQEILVPYSSGKTSKFEAGVQVIFRDIFNVNPLTIRPKWLENPYTDRALEIDGVCEVMTSEGLRYVCYEANGVQHYKFTHHFHKSMKEFNTQVMRDLYKYEILRNKPGWILVIVRYDEVDIRSYIISELRKYSELHPFLSRLN